MQDSDIAPAPETQPVRVSISEAARLFGISEKTIRRAITAGELRYVLVQNRYKIHFGSLVAWSQKSTHLQTQRDQNGIGQWVDQWKIKNTRFSPRPPATPPTTTLDP